MAKEKKKLPLAAYIFAGLVLGILVAMKAGKVSSGEFATEQAVKSGSAYLVILAETASANTQKKFRNMCAYYKVPCILFGDKEQLGRAIGREYRSSLAVCEAHFAEKIAALLAEA